MGLILCIAPLVHLHVAGWNGCNGAMALLYFLMNEMDWVLHPCLQVLWHVYRRGLDWFQQPWSFRLETKMCFGPFHRMYARLDEMANFLRFLINEMDLPSCLRVLQHVYRRGLDWFQQHWFFHLELAMCFGGPFGT